MTHDDLISTVRQLSVATAFAVLLSACGADPADRIARAQQHMAEGDYASAVLEARNALQEEPANIEARLLFANASRGVGDFRTAAAEFVRARELGADLPQFLLPFAESLLVIGGADQVVEELAEALQAEPANPQHRLMLAHAFAAINEPESATSLYRDVIERDPSQADAYVGLATLAEQAGDDATSAEWSARAQRTVPDSPELQLFLAQRENNPEARAEIAKRAYELINGSVSPLTRAQVLLVRVENFLQLGDADNASAMLQEYQSLYPGAPQTLFLQSLIALERGNVDRARNGLLRLSESMADGSPADLFLGSINLQQSNLRQAEAYLNKALRFDRNSVAARKLLAETLLQLNRPKEALEVLSALAPEQTEDGQVLALLGRAAVASGNPSDGVGFFERSSAELPGDPGLQLATAYSHLAAGDAAAALALLERVEDDAAGGYRSSLLRMLAHLSTSDREAAIGEAERLVAENPEDSAAWSLAGQLLGNLSQFDVARRFYNRALTLDASNSEASYGLARVELADGQTDTAIRLFEDLLSDKPAYMPALAAYARIQQMKGADSDVTAAINAAVAAEPDSPEPRLLLAQYQLFNGELEAALATAETGLESTPDDPRLLQIRGKARGGLGNEEAARRDLLRAAELAPSDRLMQMDKARVLVKTGDPEGARRVVQDYLEVRPNDIEALLFSADLDLSTGRPDRAATVITEVLARDPENRTALTLQGDILRRRGDAQGALERYAAAGKSGLDSRLVLRQFSAMNQIDPARGRDLLEQWIADNPDDVTARTALAQTLDAAGDTTAALSLYEALAEQGDGDTQARSVVLNNLAWLYFTQGDARARETAEQARRLSPENPAILDTLGWIAHTAGDSDVAVSSLRRANELAPRNPEIASHLAAALVESGETEQARRLLVRALESNSRFAGRADAEALLQRLQ